MAEERFDVRFDGPALREHRIPADVLANSLLALSAAAQAAHLAVDPLAPRISLDIQAQREGSFTVDLLITDTVGILTSKEAIALATAGTIVPATYGAIRYGARLLKWLRERTLRDETDIGDGQTRLTATDGSTVIVDSSVYIAIQDRKFRESMREAVAPVGREGIDSVEIGREGDRELITKQDLPAFDVPETGEILSENIREAFLQLLTVNFQPGSKWKFTEGDAPYWAAMQDREFARRIEGHEIEFGKGDILRALIKTTQRRVGTRLTVEHAITSVLGVQKQGSQVPLPFEAELEAEE